MGDEVMDGNLQPIVAERQQLIRVIRTQTMQPMVALIKDTERRRFAERLNAAYDNKYGAPKSGRRASWLARELKMLNNNQKVVSIESARKWLGGESMPDQVHMALLSRHCGRSVQFLQTGQDEPGSKVMERRTETRHPFHGIQLSLEGARLGEEWERLPSVYKATIREQIRLLVAAHKRHELPDLEPAEKPEKIKPTARIEDRRRPS
jgi:hypothetical protein